MEPSYLKNDDIDRLWNELLVKVGIDEHTDEEWENQFNDYYRSMSPISETYIDYEISELFGADAKELQIASSTETIKLNEQINDELNDSDRTTSDFSSEL